MHIGEDAAHSDEDDGDNHTEVDEEAEFLVFEVIRQGDHSDEENGGGHHSVGGGEGGLTGAVGAVVDDPEFFENDVGEDHKDEGDEGPAEGRVDFGEAFAFDPLIEKKNAKKSETEKGKGDEEVGDNEPEILS